MTTGSIAEQVTSVPGELHYLSPQSTVLRRFTAPGASVNTGSYESHVVPIRNARPGAGQLPARHPRFRDRAPPERGGRFHRQGGGGRRLHPGGGRVRRERTGADVVVSRGWVRRRSAAPAENASQPQAALVHIDYGPEGAAMTAARVYAEQFPDGPAYRRVLATSVWRVFSPPPQDWPLALCDYRSVRDDEGLPNQLYFVDTLPDDPMTEPSTSPRWSPAARNSSTAPSTSGGTSRT